MRTATPSFADPVTRQLRTLVESHPELEQAARVYEIILPLLRDADLYVTPISLIPAEAHAKMQAGLFLLHDLDLDLDDHAARRLMIQLACALEQSGGDKRAPKTQLDAAALYEHAHDGNDIVLRANAARQIRNALEQNQIDMTALLPRVAAGDSGFVTAVAEGLRLDAGLLWTLAQNALKPALRTWAKELAPLADGTEWNKGYCFICGAGATLGELQGNEQEKHLRCGQCGADWVFRRMQCMYCGNDDHRTLAYFYPDGERENRRVEVCDRCGGYLKVIASFDPTPPELLALQDLATLHLDYIAQERGYARVAIQ